MIGAAVRALLLLDSGIVDAVGSRVYSDQMPQGASTPAITYSLISEVANDVLSGPLGVEDAVFQIEAYGQTRNEADQLHRLIKLHIAGFRGRVSDVTIRSVYQQSGLYYMTDSPEAGSDAHRYRSIQDYGFVYGSIERSC